jgi:hypothetical protein
MPIGSDSIRVYPDVCLGVTGQLALGASKVAPICGVIKATKNKFTSVTVESAKPRYDSCKVSDGEGRDVFHTIPCRTMNVQFVKLLSTIVAILVCSGCTTLEPVQVPSEQLHERMSSGEIVHVGDDVKIATADGKRHQFRVTAVTADTISGEKIDIRIVDVVAVETRKFSGGKTAALAGGGILFYLMIVAAGAAALAAGI